MAATIQVLAFKRRNCMRLKTVRSARWCCPNSTMVPRLLENVVKVTKPGSGENRVSSSSFSSSSANIAPQREQCPGQTPTNSCENSLRMCLFQLSFQRNSNIKPAISRSRTFVSWMLDAIIYCVIPCTWRDHTGSFAVAIDIANVHLAISMYAGPSWTLDLVE